MRVLDFILLREIDPYSQQDDDNEDSQEIKVSYLVERRLQGCLVDAARQGPSSDEKSRSENDE